MAATNNLYPPIIDTFMPAFVIDSSNENVNKCRVYFSLSLFNVASEINQDYGCQVTVRNQVTNTSALNTDLYPSGIMIKPLTTDINRKTEDKYYIEINKTDMMDEEWVYDQYYKVQIRFTDSSCPNPPIDLTTGKQKLDTWLAENLSHFSEWSTVCLIRGISKPTLNLKDYDSGVTTTIYNTIANVQILGDLTFDYKDETETLKSYKIIVYDDTAQSILLETDDIYTSNFSNPNELNYAINYVFETGYTYTIEVYYTTENLYTDKLRFAIQVEQGETSDLNTIVRAWTDEENGRVVLKISRSRAYGNYTGQIIVRRSDSESNFTIWEDIFTQEFEAAPYISIIWNDYTIKSGIWYKYAVQGVDENGVRTPMIEFKEPIMVLFDHAFLTIGDKQLKVKFNPQISSYRKVVNESKADTIGSRYPIIRRNGDMYYTMFSLTGTIASAMDEEGIFVTKETLYGNNKYYYDNYNDENNISSYNDFIYEKFFRDKVLDFLNAGDAKLFRSPSEGNLIVRLMNVNFQPNQQLGRMIWNFSADVYEIDECNSDNLDLYGISIKTAPKITSNNHGDALIPIRTIVFIKNDTFPDIGREGVIYIWKDQIYIWSTEEATQSIPGKYKIISIPEWNAVSEIIGTRSTTPVNNELYTNGEFLYRWDSVDEAFNEISYDALLNENEDYYQGG